MRMRAWVQTTFGGPESVTLRDIPRPVPQADEVLVRVEACALNRLDLLQQVAPLVPGFSLPHVAGMDVAGTVSATGGPEGEALVGRPVVIDPVVTCGDCAWCRQDEPGFCPSLRTVGSTRAGGLAEYVAVPARNCHVYDPEHLSPEKMASVPVASVTAWHGLLGAGGLRAGETIVIPGAGSGLGTAGIQIARRTGARVIALAAGPEKCRAAEALGAEIAFDRSAGDWVAAVRDHTGQGADFVWDSVGGAFLQQAIDACRIGGRVVLSGTTAGNDSTIRNTSLFHFGRSLIGHGGYTRREMRETIAAYRTGALAAVIDSLYGIADVPAAFARLRSGQFFGKIVISIRL
ncbi:zinc-binding dehydrogenase [Gluconacetobacter sacchari]|uniref:zinc-binding dehydrogenase n=1 Tax=Gluconacetobacter sacchari TaxID=92759 RepID=UPI0039B698B2